MAYRSRAPSFVGSKTMSRQPLLGPPSQWRRHQWRGRALLLRLPPDLRRSCVPLAERHLGRSSSGNADEIRDRHAKLQRQAEQCFERWIGPPPLQLLVVAKCNALDLLLREPSKPAGFLQILPDSSPEAVELHAATVAKQATLNHANIVTCIHQFDEEEPPKR
jgi:hypothetical protein